MDNQFKNWLVETKGFGKKSAGDVLSRCRRIEKTFGVSLDKIIHLESEVRNLHQRLQEESGSYLKPDTNPVYGVSVVRRALSLYTEYKLQEASLNS